FAYLNLFVFFMLLLVLGGNYPILFIGWEGVGLCSYLLIGFWFSEKANADAGKKTFIVNRIGDFGLLVAMFLMFANMGTLDFIGVGSGAYVAGVFHLVTHAFFKALLFLGSGSVIFAMHRAYHHTGNHDDAQDMRNMGGLKQYMPTTFALMWIATLAIAGIPPLAGFFSKDEILGAVFERAQHSTIASASLFGVPGTVWLYFAWILGLASAFM